MARSAEVLSHWHTLLEGMNTSGLEFYQALEQELAKKELPDVTFTRVDWRESGVLSARREYLRVSRGKLTFDVCAAPYGTGFFFSWWLARQPPRHTLAIGCLGTLLLPIVAMWFMSKLGIMTGLFTFALLAAVALFLLVSSLSIDSAEDSIIAIPIFGALYLRLVRPVTYYSTDTTLMFQESVHNAVIDVIAGLTSSQGLRALAPEMTRPTLRSPLG